MQSQLPLDLSHEGRVRMRFDKDATAFAALLEPTGEAAQSPVFAVYHDTLVGLELARDTFDDAADLVPRHIVSSNRSAFVERHDGPVPS